jgi:hypothetical protein
LKKRNNKQGAAATEAVLAIAIIIPILIGFIFGGYDFYLKQADNVNLNFQAGRYFTTMTSCDSATLASISLNQEFSHYNVITVIDGKRKEAYKAAKKEGTIIVYCNVSE